MVNDWEDLKDVDQPCGYSNGWCGWCGNCCEHAEDLRERDEHYRQEGWDDI